LAVNHVIALQGEGVVYIKMIAPALCKVVRDNGADNVFVSCFGAARWIQVVC